MHFRRLFFAGFVGLTLVLITIASWNQVVEARQATTAPVHIPLIASGFCGTYYDSFDGPLGGWFIGNREGLNAEIIDGEYRLSFSGIGSVWLISGPMCERRSYHAAVDVRWVGVPGNFVGLLIEVDEMNNNALVFAVNTDTRVWLVTEVRNGSLSMLVPPTGNDAVLPGNSVNRLAAARTGDVINLQINGTPVGELRGVNGDTLVLAGVAVASYTNQTATEARFDNFIFNPAINE